MALMDMGGEYHCYGSDITCSYPVSVLEYPDIYFDRYFVPTCNVLELLFCYLLLKSVTTVYLC